MKNLITFSIHYILYILNQLEQINQLKMDDKYECNLSSSNKLQNFNF